MAAKLIYTAAVPGQYEVKLYQSGVDSFQVRYGLQLKTGLDYTAAAAELGACIMHACACQGELDNRTREEAMAERGV